MRLASKMVPILIMKGLRHRLQFYASMQVDLPPILPIETCQVGFGAIYRAYAPSIAVSHCHADPRRQSIFAVLDASMMVIARVRA